MAARILLLLANLIAFAVDAPSPRGESVLFLGYGLDRAVDPAAILDAVTIYTRDLGLTIERAMPRRPPPASPSEVDEVAAFVRTRGARLAFFCGRAGGDRSLELVIVDGRGTVRRHLFREEGPAPREIYRVVALKVRASVTSLAATGAVAAASPGDSDPPEPAPGSSAPDVGSSAVAAGPPPPLARRPPQPPPPRRRSPTEDDRRPLSADRSLAGSAPPASHPVFLAVDYALSVPTGSAPSRHAAAIHGVAFVADRVEVDLGVELAPSAERQVPAGSVRVVDVPVRLGARWVWHTRSSYLIAFGALGGLHALFAEGRGAPPDLAAESTRTIAASLGVELVARGPAMYGVAPEFRLFGEVNAPETRFRLRGSTAFEEGVFTLGGGLGLALPAH